MEQVPKALGTVIAGLQSLRGIAKISAVTLVAEHGKLSGFSHPRQLMGYFGAVSRQHSSGPNVRRDSISENDSAHLRRIMTEAAGEYVQRRPNPTGPAHCCCGLFVEVESDSQTTLSGQQSYKRNAEPWIAGV